MNDDKFSFLTENGFLYDKDLGEWYKDLGETDNLGENR